MATMHVHSSNTYLPGRMYHSYNYGPSRIPNHGFQNESLDHWCDTCDKGFATAYFLENHKRQHQKCNIDGCQFIGHPKVITRHIQMQHSTGLYNKIAKSNDPEEIKKWREERKKKYPTKENIEKKAASVKEKISRGEKMGIDHKGHKRSHKDSTRRGQYSTFKNMEHQRKRKLDEISTKITPKKRKQKKIINILPPLEETRTLKPFGGLQNLVFQNDVEPKIDLSHDNLIEDDEYVSNPLTGEKEKSKPVCGALSSLMCLYGSSSEDEHPEEIDNNNPIAEKNNRQSCENIQTSVTDNHKVNNSNQLIPHKSNKKEMLELLPTQPSVNLNISNENADDSGPEECKIVKETEINEKLIDSRNNVNSNRPKLHRQRPEHKLKARNNTFRRKLPSTLLEKLLHREIQSERNVVLQCIRYVVQNNYFNNCNK